MAEKMTPPKTEDMAGKKKREEVRRIIRVIGAYRLFLGAKVVKLL